MTREEIKLAEEIYETSYYDKEYDARNKIINNKQKVLDILDKFLIRREEIKGVD